MMKHIIFMKFEDPKAAPVVAEALSSLKGCSPLLLDIEVGLDFVHSTKSYDLAYTATFPNPQADAEFDEDPTHQKVKAILSQYKKTVVKVDYLME